MHNGISENVNVVILALQIWPYVECQGQQPRNFYFIHDWIGENVYAVIFALGM